MQSCFIIRLINHMCLNLTILGPFIAFICPSEKPFQLDLSYLKCAYVRTYGQTYSNRPSRMDYSSYGMYVRTSYSS